MDDVDRYIEDGVGELVELARTLVRFDTTSVDLSPGSTHRTNDEAALQAFVAGELRGLGAEVDQWEPDAAELGKYADNSISLEGAKAQQMLKLMEALEDHEDVQNVWANFDISDKEMEAAAAAG